MIDYKQSSMVDIAYELLTKKKKPVNFYKLWEEVAQIKGFSDEEMNENESLFYSDITLDGRIITTGENNWDLRSRHKFEEVHIDMNDIYAEEEEEVTDDDGNDGLEEDDYN
ncbi:MAG: DNA-directed RNA polymerase subunit delta [Erysipelotrichaceae bacterium]|nr:DNA-directed RNA polymerase subunit delta [Erysipelotrichaceae bacterium]